MSDKSIFDYMGHLGTLIYAATQGFKPLRLISMIVWSICVIVVIYFTIQISTNYFDYFQIKNELEIVNSINSNPPIDLLIINKSLALKVDLLKQLEKETDFTLLMDFTELIKNNYTKYLILYSLPILIVLVSAFGKKKDKNAVYGGLVFIVILCLIDYLIPEIISPNWDAFLTIIVILVPLMILGQLKKKSN